MQGNAFRPIYYLGCKTSFAAAVKAAIDDVDPLQGRLCDLFAGTGAIATHLGKFREVTAVDIQEYSRVLCSATLSPVNLSQAEIAKTLSTITDNEQTRLLSSCFTPLIEYENECISKALEGSNEQLASFLEAAPLKTQANSPGNSGTEAHHLAIQHALEGLKATGLLDSPDTIVTRYFGGVYFSFRQAIFLDSALSYASSNSGGVRDVLTAVALSTASHLVNTVGKQFAQPIQPRSKGGKIKQNLGTAVQRDRSLDAAKAYSKFLHRYSTLSPARANSSAVQMDYLEALQLQGKTFSVIYADPPYTRDHYSRFYHVLETMCLRDEPAISSVTKRGNVEQSRGLYREERHQSPFCIRSEAPDAFANLFKESSELGVPLVLSYSPHESGDGTHPRVVSTKKILEIANSYFPNVELIAIDGSTHNKLNRTGLQLDERSHAEIILKCFR